MLKIFEKIIYLKYIGELMSNKRSIIDFGKLTIRGISSILKEKNPDVRLLDKLSKLMESLKKEEISANDIKENVSLYRLNIGNKHSVLSEIIYKCKALLKKYDELKEGKIEKYKDLEKDYRNLRRILYRKFVFEIRDELNILKLLVLKDIKLNKNIMKFSETLEKEEKDSSYKRELKFHARREIAPLLNKLHSNEVIETKKTPYYDAEILKIIEYVNELQRKEREYVKRLKKLTENKSLYKRIDALKRFCEVFSSDNTFEKQKESVTKIEDAIIQKMKKVEEIKEIVSREGALIINSIKEAEKSETLYLPKNYDDYDDLVKRALNGLARTDRVYLLASLESCFINIKKIAEVSDDLALKSYITRNMRKVFKRYPEDFIQIFGRPITTNGQAIATIAFLSYPKNIIFWKRRGMADPPKYSQISVNYRTLADIKLKRLYTLQLEELGGKLIKYKLVA